MSSLQIGRLLIGPPLQWTEPFGDPVQGEGGAVVSAARIPPTYPLTLGTLAADGESDTLTARLRIRRQLRSLLNNTPLKLGMFIYLVYSDDLEQDGWYVPDASTLTDYTGATGLATGLWQIASGNWYLQGRQRTHREARSIWMKDLRTGLYARDILGQVYSTDFSWLSALALSYLPAGAVSAADTVTGSVVSGPPTPTGRDGGACQVIEGLVDMQTIAYDRPESNLNLSDVIVYDRRGQITAPTTGPDTMWEEAYGPDHAWNWQNAGQPEDAPVLDNGLIRIRFDDSVSIPGLRMDVWNGTAYVEQGKLLVERVGDSVSYCDTWVSAGLTEWTPERAVISLVLASSSDPYSRERVFVTMQRGEITATFESYPALTSTGANADNLLHWVPAQADANISALKIDSQTAPPAESAGVIAATAGTGTSLWSGYSALGAATFAASENWVAVLRCSAPAAVTPYQINILVRQGVIGALYGEDSVGYGAARNHIAVGSEAGSGYVQARIGFTPTAADQIVEAETIRNVSGTTSQVSDATASNGLCVEETQTSVVHVTLTRGSTSLIQGVYHVMARVKVSSGAEGVVAITGSSFAPTTTATAWTWLDLGEALVNTGFPSVSAYVVSGSGGVFIDRLELALVQDRTRTGATYDGVRDRAQASLYDSRLRGALVAR